MRKRATAIDGPPGRRMGRPEVAGRRRHRLAENRLPRRFSAARAGNPPQLRRASRLSMLGAPPPLPLGGAPSGPHLPSRRPRTSRPLQGILQATPTRYVRGESEDGKTVLWRVGGSRRNTEPLLLPPPWPLGLRQLPGKPATSKQTSGTSPQLLRKLFKVRLEPRLRFHRGIRRQVSPWHSRSSANSSLG